MNPSTRRYYPGMRGTDPAPAAAPQQAPPQPDEMLVTLDRTLTNAERANDVGINIDKDADFLLTHIWGTSTGLYTIHLKQFNGRALSTSPVRNDNLVGTVQFKSPLRPALYPAGSRISLDLVNLTAVDNVVQLVFGGVRLLRGR